MKGTLAAIAMIAGFLAMTATEAAAWSCYASSRSGYGRSWNYGTRAGAVRRALAECAARTPRWQTCYIRWCRR